MVGGVDTLNVHLHLGALGSHHLLPGFLEVSGTAPQSPALPPAVLSPLLILAILP